MITRPDEVEKVAMFAIQYDHPKRYPNAYEYQYIEIWKLCLKKQKFG